VRALWTVLGCLGPLALALSFAALAVLGRRMGEALRARPFYLLYLVASALLVAATVAALVCGAAGWWSSSEEGAARCAALAVLLPFAAASCLSLYATLRYWRWIWLELRATCRDGRGGAGIDKPGG
jgi:hypothetical protein